MLSHEPGGIIQRSFEQVDLAAFSQYNESIKSTKPSLTSPAVSTPNPYQANASLAAGISLYTASPVTQDNQTGTSPVFTPGGSSSYGGGLQQSSTLTESKGDKGKPNSVSSLPSYSSGAATFALNTVAANKPEGAPTLQVSSVVSLGPSSDRQSSAGVGFGISAGNSTVPSLTITYTTEPDPVVACAEGNAFPPGTLNCPPGFVPLLNGLGQEVGCIETPEFTQGVGQVGQGILPKDVLTGIVRTPLTQEWYAGSCPEGSRQIRAINGLVLCELAFPPNGGV